MKIYWDYENQQLMDGLNSGQIIQSLTHVLNDQVDITLLVMKANDATLLNELCDLPVGMGIVYGIKGTTRAKLAGTYLAVQTIWTKIADGTYTATIDLATTELGSELGAEVSASLKGEFTAVDVDDKHHYSTQIDLIINHDLNRGDESGVHSLALGNVGIVREEVRSGQKHLVFYNSDGVEYLSLLPPGA